MINYCITYHENIVDVAFMTILNPLLKIPYKYGPRQIVLTWNSLQNWCSGISFILKCCTLSENTVAQVFSSISTKHRKPYLVKVIKLTTRTQHVSFLVISSKLSKWRHKTTSSADSNFLLSILVQNFLSLNDNFVYMLVYIHVRSRNRSLSIFVKIFNSIISSWPRRSCCLIDPLPKAAVQTHMEVLVGDTWYPIVCVQSIYNK